MLTIFNQYSTQATRYFAIEDKFLISALAAVSSTPADLACVPAFC